MERDQATLRWSLVTTDIATPWNGRAYPLQHHAIASTGRQAAGVVGGRERWTPLQWVELAGGTVPGLARNGRQSRHPVKSRQLAGAVSRHWCTSLVSMWHGTPWRLALVRCCRRFRRPGMPLVGAGTSSTLIIESNECLQWGGGFFGSSCTKWTNRVDRIAWRSGVRTRVLHYDGATELFGTRRTGWRMLGYVYCRFECSRRTTACISSAFRE
jgi:hypothetical protein